MKPIKIVNSVCLDCGKPKKFPKSIRCVSCSKKGKLNPMFGEWPIEIKKGTITKSGSRKINYIDVYVEKKLVKKHRWIMEQFLGRKLTEDDIIHHKNGNGLDNRMENLQLTTKSEHRKLHILKTN